jgi:hypothetical protein
MKPYPGGNIPSPEGRSSVTHKYQKPGWVHSPLTIHNSKLCILHIVAVAKPKNKKEIVNLQFQWKKEKKENSESGLLIFFRHGNGFFHATIIPNKIH